MGQSLLHIHGPVDRSTSRWTIHAASTLAQAEAGHYPLRVGITEAWFIGNGPTR
jgi:hypothetical protein